MTLEEIEELEAIKLNISVEALRAKRKITQKELEQKFKKLVKQQYVKRCLHETRNQDPE